MIVVARPAGQLANRLFQFAQFVALAAEAEVTVADPALGHYARHFPAFARDAACRYPAPKRPLPPRLRSAVVSAAAAGLRAGTKIPGVEVVELSDGMTCDLDGPAFRRRVAEARVTLVGGWGFNGTQTFHRHFDELRRVFAPSRACRTAAEDALHAARRGAGLVVGVHRRRGDYAHWNEGRFLFPDAAYGRVMRSVADALGKDVSFLVCSDEPVDPDTFPGVQVTPGPGSPIVDLQALSLCDYIVGPPSTFSAWASFMGDVPRYELHDPDSPVTHESFKEVGGP
ncbi:MAG: hypothetical protein QOH95_2519 [Gaiellaceae bacterium]|nr:hypothetical protein [Gaiellaceae bacterium]